MMYMLLSSDRFPPAFNAGFYQNPRVDELLRNGRTTIDEKERVLRLSGGGLHAYIARRLVLALPVLFGVSLLVFAVLHLAPGDPAAIMLGAQAMSEDVERLRRDLGLDQPLPIQYVRWIGHVLRGDLGQSIPLGREVLPEVLLRFKSTLSPPAPS